MKSFTNKDYAVNGLSKKHSSRFESAFEYASIGMALVSVEGRWLQVNNSLCEMLGYSKEEFYKIDFQSITHSDYLEVDLNYVRDMLDGKIDYYEMEKIYIHKNGNHVWGLLSVSLVFDSYNKPKYFISQIQNITERKEAEQISEEYMRELEASNEQLEEFAHLVSHDLKEPVRGVANYASIILCEYEDKINTDMKKLLESQIGLLGKMNLLLDNLLYYSRIGHTEKAFKSCNTLEIINTALELQEAFIKENNVQVALQEMPKEIFCDPLRIQEVFYNLINNGVKYNLKPLKKITIGYDSEINAFYVRDNGIGVGKLQQDKIFKIFRRAHTNKNLPEGNGLGLSVVRKIIKRHKGDIWCSANIDDDGSTFFFTIR